MTKAQPFKGILKDLALSFVLVENLNFELPWFSPSYPPEMRDLCIFLSGKNPLMMQKLSFCVIRVFFGPRHTHP